MSVPNTLHYKPIGPKSLSGPVDVDRPVLVHVPRDQQMGVPKVGHGGNRNCNCNRNHDCNPKQVLSRKVHLM